mmetsp:Transcript_67874/g.155706  ORF Transcript_67874/g.155706 Transcript_67874/m.155706 type:complete len:274 (-) Transcript_67874:936-1757(-)
MEAGQTGRFGSHLTVHWCWRREANAAASTEFSDMGGSVWSRLFSGQKVRASVLQQVLRPSFTSRLYMPWRVPSTPRQAGPLRKHRGLVLCISTETQFSSPAQSVSHSLRKAHRAKESGGSSSSMPEHSPVPGASHRRLQRAASISVVVTWFKGQKLPVTVEKQLWVGQLALEAMSGTTASNTSASQRVQSARLPLTTGPSAAQLFGNPYCAGGSGYSAQKLTFQYPGKVSSRRGDCCRVTFSIRVLVVSRDFNLLPALSVGQVALHTTCTTGS